MEFENSKRDSKLSNARSSVISNLKKSDSIFVTGHRGLLGSALIEELKIQGYSNLITAERSELDLTLQKETFEFLKARKPAAVIHCAALVGGIQANTTRPAEFSAVNLVLQNNVIHGSHLAGIKHLVFFGSNCMYPTGANQPIPETQLLQGPMEASNLAYGTAKAAGVTQVDSYRKQYGYRYFSVIPASLYGPNDNFDPAQSHVTPALLLKFHQAKIKGASSIQLWGTGEPRRELLYSADAAKGTILLLEKYTAEQGTINLGAGDDLSVREIGETIAQIVGFAGKLEFDNSKPNGNMRKLLDSSRARSLGFKPQVALREGLNRTYAWLKSADFVRGVSRSDR